MEPQPLKHRWHYGHHAFSPFALADYKCSFDVLTIICHLDIVGVCVIVILYIGNTQISILLLCFLYLFVEFVITMSE